MSSSEGDCAYRTKRAPYTMREDHKIIDYIIYNNEYHNVKAKAMWKRMATELHTQGSNRSWQSLKERFLKTIYLNLDHYKIDQGTIQLFRKPFNAKNLKSKPQRANHGPGQPYTDDEDDKIIKFVLKRRGHIKGNQVWIALEASKLIPGRSWMSMRSRFVNTIMKNLPRHTDPDTADRLEKLWNGDDDSEDEEGERARRDVSPLNSHDSPTAAQKIKQPSRRRKRKLLSLNFTSHFESPEAQESNRRPSSKRQERGSPKRPNRRTFLSDSSSESGFSLAENDSLSPSSSSCESTSKTTLSPTCESTSKTTLSPTCESTSKTTLSPTFESTSKTTLSPSCESTSKTTLSPACESTSKTTLSPACESTSKAPPSPSQSATSKASPSRTCESTLNFLSAQSSFPIVYLERWVPPSPLTTHGSMPTSVCSSSQSVSSKDSSSPGCPPRNWKPSGKNNRVLSSSSSSASSKDSSGCLEISIQSAVTEVLKNATLPCACNDDVANAQGAASNDSDPCCCECTLLTEPAESPIIKDLSLPLIKEEMTSSSSERTISPQPRDSPPPINQPLGMEGWLSKPVNPVVVKEEKDCSNLNVNYSVSDTAESSEEQERVPHVTRPVIDPLYQDLVDVKFGSVVYVEGTKIGLGPLQFPCVEPPYDTDSYSGSDM